MFAWLLASVCGCFLFLALSEVDDDAREKVPARFSFAGLGRFVSCQNLDADGASGSPSV